MKYLLIPGVILACSAVDKAGDTDLLTVGLAVGILLVLVATIPRDAWE